MHINSKNFNTEVFLTNSGLCDDWQLVGNMQKLFLLIPVRNFGTVVLLFSLKIHSCFSNVTRLDSNLCSVDNNKQSKNKYLYYIKFCWLFTEQTFISAIYWIKSLELTYKIKFIENMRDLDICKYSCNVWLKKFGY